jgi:hypothetical protein
MPLDPFQIGGALLGLVQPQRLSPRRASLFVIAEGGMGPAETDQGVGFLVRVAVLAAQREGPLVVTST